MDSVVEYLRNNYGGKLSLYVLLKICCNFRFHHGLNLSSLTLVVQLMMLTSLYQIPLHVFKVCFNGHQLDVI